jgi:hypothetical protein
MALQDSDLLLVNRGGTNYQTTLSNLRTAVGGTTQFINFTPVVNPATGLVNTTQTVSHNLGKVPLVVAEWVNDFGVPGGWQITNVTSSAITIQIPSGTRPGFTLTFCLIG